MAARRQQAEQSEDADSVVDTPGAEPEGDAPAPDGAAGQADGGANPGGG